MISAQYVDNNAIASANIQKPKKSSIWHMVRHGFQAKSVHPEWSHLNEVNMTGEEAVLLELDLLDKAREAYRSTHNNRPFKSENNFLEMVVNLNANHTLKDAQKVADLIKEFYGYTTTLMSLHKDEGHYDENGNFVANVHLHLRLCVLDLETGENLYRKNLSSKKMCKFQDELAKLLNMKRGEPARVTKRKHLSPGEYKGMIERVETMTLEDVQKINKEVREALKINKAERKHYVELENVVNMTKKALKLDEKVLMKDFAKAINGALAKITKDGAEALANALKDFKVTQGKDGLKFERVKPTNGLNVHYAANPTLDASISQIGAQMVASYQAGYQAGYNLASSEAKQPLVVDYSSMSNFNINVGAGATFQNVVMAGTSISVEAGAVVKNCQFNDKEPIVLPKCSLSNCIVDPLPNYGILAGKSFAESYLGDDQGYLVVNGVSTKPKQPDLKRRSSADSLDMY